MASPSKTDVALNCTKLISVFSDTDESEISGSQILTKVPLSMDATSLAYLATSLRQYIKKNKKKATILVGEVRKTDLKVSELIDLVYQKITT